MRADPSMLEKLGAVEKEDPSWRGWPASEAGGDEIRSFPSLAMSAVSRVSEEDAGVRGREPEASPWPLGESDMACSELYSC